MKKGCNFATENKNNHQQKKKIMEKKETLEITNNNGATANLFEEEAKNATVIAAAAEAANEETNEETATASEEEEEQTPSENSERVKKLVDLIRGEMLGDYALVKTIFKLSEEGDETAKQIAAYLFPAGKCTKATAGEAVKLWQAALRVKVIEEGGKPVAGQILTAKNGYHYGQKIDNMWTVVEDTLHNILGGLTTPQIVVEEGKFYTPGDYSQPVAVEEITATEEAKKAEAKSKRAEAKSKRDQKALEEADVVTLLKAALAKATGEAQIAAISKALATFYTED